MPKAVIDPITFRRIVLPANLADMLLEGVGMSFLGPIAKQESDERIGLGAE